VRSDIVTSNVANKVNPLGVYPDHVISKAKPQKSLKTMFTNDVIGEFSLPVKHVARNDI
jgi:hypothetical protein